MSSSARFAESNAIDPFFSFASSLFPLIAKSSNQSNQVWADDSSREMVRFGNYSLVGSRR